MGERKSSWPPVLIVVGLLLGIGSAVNAAVRPADRWEFVAYSVVGFALLGWGMVLSNRPGPGGKSARDRR